MHVPSFFRDLKGQLLAEFNQRGVVHRNAVFVVRLLFLVKSFSFFSRDVNRQCFPDNWMLFTYQPEIQLRQTFVLRKDLNLNQLFCQGEVVIIGDRQRNGARQCEMSCENQSSWTEPSTSTREL
jgi:hypothetical protein